MTRDNRGKVTTVRAAFRIDTAALLLALLALMLGTARTALAHAELVRSEPPANAVLATVPSELRLWFSEEPEPRFSQVQLLDASGNAVGPTGDLASDPSDPTELRVSLGPLSPGAYTVVWRATSADDGHVDSGSFGFTAGSGQPVGGSGAVRPNDERAAGPSPAEIAIRWATYLGMSLLAGGLAFLVLVLRPVLRRGALDAGWIVESALDPSPGLGLKDNVSETAIGPGVRLPTAILLRLVAAGWAFTLVAAALAAIAQAASGAGVPVGAALGSPLVTLITSTRYGALFWLRLMLLVAIPAVILSVRRMRKGHNAISSAMPIALALSLLVLLTTALTSHAASMPNAPAAILADWLHLAAASFWVGGLISLVVVLRAANRQRLQKGDYLTAELVGRFSYLAGFCVVVLGATGLLETSRQLSGWEDLLDTPYGNTLLTKIGLLIPLLALAGANRFFVQRRLQRHLEGGEQANTAGRWHGLLLRTVGGEVLLVSAVLLVASVLTALPPSSEALGSGLVVRGEENGLRAVLAISPGRVGPSNSFDIYMRDELLRPVTRVEKVALILANSDMPEMGQAEAVATDLGDGHYRVQGDYLSMEGRWAVEVLVRRQEEDDVRIRMTFEPRTTDVGAAQAP